MNQAMNHFIRIASDEEERRNLPKSMKVKHSPPGAHEGGMAQFGTHLCDADLSGVDSERDRLQFERGRLLSDLYERVRERDERREDRIEAENLKLTSSGS